MEKRLQYKTKKGTPIRLQLFKGNILKKDEMISGEGFISLENIDKACIEDSMGRVYEYNIKEDSLAVSHSKNIRDFLRSDENKKKVDKDFSIFKDLAGFIHGPKVDVKTRFLYLHLLAEYCVNELLNLLLKKPNYVVCNRIFFGYTEKLILLRAFGVLDDQKYKNFNLLGEIRNIILHDLRPSNEKINRIIKEKFTPIINIRILKSDLRYLLHCFFSEIFEFLLEKKYINKIK